MYRYFDDDKGHRYCCQSSMAPTIAFGDKRKKYLIKYRRKNAFYIHEIVGAHAAVIFVQLKMMCNNNNIIYL